MRACTRCQEQESGNDPNYEGLCAACAWKEWFESTGDGWNSVACVECELGRECDEHAEQSQ